MADIEVPVLIVGSSLVGMSTALQLGHHGIPALAVEHHRGTAIHPRAAQITQRSMEILRMVGIEQIVRAKSDEQFVQDGAIMAVETLAGKELGYFIANLNEGVRDVSPCERVFISQSLLEPLLRSRAEELGARLRFATDLVSFEQYPDHVHAVIRQRDSGDTDHVRAQYMVAADGAHSRVRDSLGIGMQGRGVFSRSVTIYFRADVNALLRGRNLSVIYVNHPQLRGFFRIEKPFTSGFLAVNAIGDPANPVTDVATDLSEERCREWVRLALGSDEVPITIDNVMPWNAEANCAERYQQGRVFIAGDAAHAMPPNGGFGGNTGIQDAHNLAWKLAMVLRKEAGPDLLDTYDAERRPVGTFTTEQAYSRYVTRTAPYLGTDGIQPVAPDLNVELGYRYDSPALCHAGDPGPLHENPRESRGRVGTRAPHAWITINGKRMSTIDLFGVGRFVMLTGPHAQSWLNTIRAVGESGRVPLRDIDVYSLDAPAIDDPEGAVAEAYGLTSDVVLIRPDGFVAWRSKTPTGSPSAIVGAVSQAICKSLTLSS
ncbi:MAG TPA: FAD-dependent monooxygenase [Vicinamibacterales bacterium]|nr:FAD-dependent monooxygenase [Vicinamibacterales bacterium]